MIRYDKETTTRSETAATSNKKYEPTECTLLAAKIRVESVKKLSEANKEAL